MFRTLNDVIAPNGKNKLPLLPDIHDVYMTNDGTLMFGKKRKTKITNRKKKVVKRTRKQPVSKLLKTEAKKLGIKLTTKRGEKRIAKSEKVLRAQVSKRKAMKVKKNIKPPKSKTVKKTVTKRRKRVATKTRGKKAQSYVTHGKKGLRKSPKFPVDENSTSKFGTYWDNTQLLYAKSAASQQPAGTESTNKYPYFGDMVPYFNVGNHTTVPFPNFGRRRRSRFGSPSAPTNRGMWNPMVQTPMGQGVSRNYCKSGTQCGSFPRAVEQAYPFTTD